MKLIRSHRAVLQFLSFIKLSAAVAQAFERAVRFPREDGSMPMPSRPREHSCWKGAGREVWLPCCVHRVRVSCHWTRIFARSLSVGDVERTHKCMANVTSLRHWRLLAALHGLWMSSHSENLLCVWCECTTTVKLFGWSIRLEKQYINIVHLPVILNIYIISLMEEGVTAELINHMSDQHRNRAN